MTIVVLCTKTWAGSYYPIVSSCASAREPTTSRGAAAMLFDVAQEEKRRAPCAPLVDEKDLVLPPAPDNRGLRRPHQLLRIGKIRLRYADLLLEVIDHVFPQPHFSGLLGNAHLVDLVLQTQ